MLRIAETVPVRTRLPGAVWIVAAVVTLCSLMSTLTHHHARASLEHAIEQVKDQIRAKV